MKTSSRRPLRHVVAAASLLAVSSVLAACSAGADGSDLGANDEQDLTTGGSGLGCTPKKVGAYALGGTLLLPSGPEQGYVVVQDEKIAAVVSSRAQVPAGISVVDTGAIVSPGLIDLHNHVAYDFIPLWNVGKRFQNRYQWAGIQAYGPAVKDPYNAVKNAGDQCAGLKYGEFRAIVGGTTTIQGSADLSCTRSWVRNVEFENFCEDHVRQDVLPVSNLKPADAQQLNLQFASGQTKAFFVHLAEGIDDASRAEFETMRKLDLLKPQVVAIHATALDPSQLQEMGQIGMKIVWSPLSNLILYGQTTDIPTALKAGVKVALAPDWSPSGSANVLGELKVADRVNKERFGGLLTDEQLWQMVTTNPAQIAALDDKIGSIAPGLYADLVVVRGDASSPYRAIIDAKPADVLLTTVSGEAFYGDESIVSGIGSTRQFVPVDACGETRMLSAVEANPAVTNGAEGLAGVDAKLTKDGVSQVIPLFQCGPPPESAFH